MSRRSSRIATKPPPQRTLYMQADDLLVVKKEENAAPAPSTPKKKRKAKVQQKSPGPSPKKRSPTKAAAPKLILCSSDLAKISSENPWMDLQVPPHELRPSTTLTTGQCFNWMVVHDDTIDLNNSNSTQSASSSAWGTHNETEWVGPVQDLALSIRETPSTTLYRIRSFGSRCEHDTLPTLEPLYQEWSANDERLSKIAPVIPGVIIIRQDPPIE